MTRRTALIFTLLFVTFTVKQENTTGGATCISTILTRTFTCQPKNYGTASFNRAVQNPFLNCYFITSCNYKV